MEMSNDKGLLEDYWKKYGDSSEYDDIYDAFRIGQRTFEARERALVAALRAEHDSLSGEFGACSHPCEVCNLIEGDPNGERKEDQP